VLRHRAAHGDDASQLVGVQVFAQQRMEAGEDLLATGKDAFRLPEAVNNPAA
jgi:hypothetical protein